MITRFCCLLFAIVVGSPAHAQEVRSQSDDVPTSTAPAPAPVIFFDIAGQPSAKLADFYGRIFGWTIAADGRFTTNVVSPPLVPHPDYRAGYANVVTTISVPLSRQIRPDPAEKRVYLGVADITATLAAIKQLGGTVEMARFEVPGVVVLGLFKDPAGNAMGLIELDGDRVRIPK